MPRPAFILWMVFKGKLLTRNKPKQRGCLNNGSCVLCDEETYSSPFLLDAPILNVFGRRCGEEMESIEMLQVGKSKGTDPLEKLRV